MPNTTMKLLVNTRVRSQPASTIGPAMTPINTIRVD